MTDNPISVTVNGARRAPLSRREAMQWVMGTVAASALPGTAMSADAPPGAVAQEEGRTVAPQEAAAKIPDPTGKGYGTDPNLIKTYKPGELWPLTFTDAQRQTAIVLADTIIPKDDLGPAASEVGVVEMIDEWISAPYPQQQADRPIVLKGLAWLDAVSATRFGKTFSLLSTEQRRGICDGICFTDRAAPAFKSAAAFFSRFRALCAGAYYATPAGWKAIGYVGNVPLHTFDGPPPDVLEKLGLTQTVQ